MSRYDRLEPPLEELHWLPVFYRIRFKILLLTYKAINDLGPTYLKELLIWKIPKRSLRSSNDILLTIPITKLKTYGDRSFKAAAPKLWNSLPKEIRESDSVTSFKRALKTHLFKEAYKCWPFVDFYLSYYVMWFYVNDVLFYCIFLCIFYSAIDHYCILAHQKWQIIIIIIIVGVSWQIL